MVKSNKPKAFKFANFITQIPEFISLVKAIWQVEIEGHAMFRLVKKLKKFKPIARKITWENGNIRERVKVLCR